MKKIEQEIIGFLSRKFVIKQQQVRNHQLTSLYHQEMRRIYVVYKTKELLGKRLIFLFQSMNYFLISYLNALIQTLLFTREFRGRKSHSVSSIYRFIVLLEPLFTLTPKDLNLSTNSTESSSQTPLKVKQNSVRKTNKS